MRGGSVGDPRVYSPSKNASACTLYSFEKGFDTIVTSLDVFRLQIKLYNTVIDDVIAGVRDAFLDEGVDEQVLQEMKQVWTSKLMASKAVEVTIDPIEPQAPPAVSNNPPKSKVSQSDVNLVLPTRFDMSDQLTSSNFGFLVKRDQIKIASIPGRTA